MTTDLDFTLAQLADENKPVSRVNLTILSDLSRAHTESFKTVWATVGPARRNEIISAMVEQAEADIHLNFHAILRNCLDDPQATVRRLAVEGLWEDERPTLIQPLLGVLEKDTDPEVRAVAATSLGRFVLLGALGDIDSTSSRKVEGALRATWLRGDEAVDVRRRALESLAYSDDEDISSFIETAYFDENDAMRQSAILAMGRTAEPRWARYVLNELNSVTAPMRFEAATSAGELRLTGALKTLVRLLDDPDNSVREAAALALGKIGGKEAQRVLQAVAQSEEDRLSEAAQEALEELAFNSDELEESALIDFTPEPSVATGADGEADWEEELEADDEDYGDEFAESNEDDDGWDDEEDDELGWIDEEDEGLEDEDS
jgi:HEAT repeat protein